MDAMIDLETWGTRPGCAIRSIGLVTFDLWRPEAEINKFYCNIDEASWATGILTREKGTIDWWERQPREARDALVLNQRPLEETAIRVERFMRENHVGCVWSQGANFDVVLWEAACRAVGREAPWRFFNARDTRTLYDAAGLDTRTITRAGTYHNALDDAEHQVECVRRAWAMLNDPFHIEVRKSKMKYPPAGGSAIRPARTAPIMS